MQLQDTQLAEVNARLDTMTTSINKMGNDTDKFVNTLMPPIILTNTKVDTLLDSSVDIEKMIKKDIPFIGTQVAHLTSIERNITNLLILFSVAVALLAALLGIMIYTRLKSAVGL